MKIKKMQSGKYCFKFEHINFCFSYAIISNDGDILIVNSTDEGAVAVSMKSIYYSIPRLVIAFSFSDVSALISDSVECFQPQ